MVPITSNTLRVPGGEIAYEVRGSGPVLLMISGGSGSSSGYVGMADYLAQQYTVVLYDRLGGPKSPLREAQADMSIERHSHDAHLLLTKLGTEPVSVFGSSAGGLVGLDLLAHYPQLVRLLIAHEPTVPGVLSAFDASQAHQLALYRSEGVMAALQQSALDTPSAREAPEADVQLPPSDMQGALAKAEVLYQHTVPAILSYQPDFETLTSLSSKLVLAAGQSSRELATFVYQATEALARRLYIAVSTFPGDHISCVLHPRAFSSRLLAAVNEFGGNL